MRGVTIPEIVWDLAFGSAPSRKPFRISLTYVFDKSSPTLAVASQSFE